MAITYKIVWPDVPNFKVPVLHRVVYGYSDALTNIAAEWEYWKQKDYHIRAWCEKNCSAAYYFHPGYTEAKFVEFEDDVDAMWFALKWG